MYRGIPGQYTKPLHQTAHPTSFPTRPSPCRPRHLASLLCKTVASHGSNFQLNPQTTLEGCGSKIERGGVAHPSPPPPPPEVRSCTPSITPRIQPLNTLNAAAKPAIHIEPIAKLPRKFCVAGKPALRGEFFCWDDNGAWVQGGCIACMVLLW
jgi:hypothetical protein